MAGAAGLGEDLLALGRRAGATSAAARRSGRSTPRAPGRRRHSRGRPRPPRRRSISRWCCRRSRAPGCRGRSRPRSPRTPVRPWVHGAGRARPRIGPGRSARGRAVRPRPRHYATRRGGDPHGRAGLAGKCLSVAWGMDARRWDQFLSFLDRARSKPTFEVEERQYRLQIAEELRRGAPNLAGRGVDRCGRGRLRAIAAGPGIRPHRAGGQPMGCRAGDAHLTARCRRSCTVSPTPAQIQLSVSSASLGRRRRRDSPRTWAPFWHSARCSTGPMLRSRRRW